MPEPTGVVSTIAPQESSLLGLVSVLAPAVVSGNTVVVLASESRPLHVQAERLLDAVELLAKPGEA